MAQDFRIKPDGMHKVKILVCTIAARLTNMLTYDPKDRKKLRIKEIKPKRRDQVLNALRSVIHQVI